jgi:transcription-repair coupling factor (superfamily II helicase)
MWDSLKEKVSGISEYQRLENFLESGKKQIRVSGLVGSSKSLVVASLIEGKDTPIIIVTPDPVSARDFEIDLKNFGARGVVSYPEDEVLPYDYHEPDRDLTGTQMRALDMLVKGECSSFVCTLRSFLKKVYTPEQFKKYLMRIIPGERYDMTSIAKRLAALGYERHQIVESKGQYALRGAIMDIFEVGDQSPVRIEFDDDMIISIKDFDIETQRSNSSRSAVDIRPPSHIVLNDEGIERLKRMLESRIGKEPLSRKRELMLPADRLENGITFFGMEHYASLMNEVGPVLNYFPGEPLVVLVDYEQLEVEMTRFREEIERRFKNSKGEGRIYPEPSEVYIGEGKLEGLFKSSKLFQLYGLKAESDIKFSTIPAKNYRRKFEGLSKEIKKLTKEGTQVFLFCYNRAQRRRMEEMFEDAAIDMDFPIGEISSGFSWPEAEVLFLSEDEIFGRFHRAYKKPKSRSRSLTYDPSYFKPGDFVVHVDHGIGRYMGMRVLDMADGETECLSLKYDGGDHLFIPVAGLRMVEKYTGAGGVDPPLSKLGSGTWAKVRKRALASAEKTANDLIKMYAEREIADGYSFGPDKLWQNEMEALFPYQETPHQLIATEEVKKDMESPRLMDRLLCGDVGFGKTEVAIRAIFKAVLSGKQCVLLVPTTVLAMQHFETLKERLRGFPVNVAVLSRFVSRSEQKRVLGEISKGRIDIVVGTHRLLSGDLDFHDLGLVVVDEEHRFGVKQKEIFKKIKKNVDVLSMTATPIPRTLHMTLAGIRDISVIDTPPRNRLPIQTEILPFDDSRIEEAVMREIERGGQVFFVHNRVQSIGVMERYLERLLPRRVKIVHAHGRMKGKKLEEVMFDFMRGKHDILVCTMIIEAGLDFPNVNTIIINNAEKLGLAQLYQLRGRVGRSDRKAYAFLLVPGNRALTSESMERLKAISEFDYLGAGYKVALKDLEIRGAGNILGHQQSGQINSVGLDLYSRMLKKEIKRIKGETVREDIDISIKSKTHKFLPENYISDSEERMDIYRRLSRITRRADLAEITKELRDRFGFLPQSAANLLKAVEMKIRAAGVGIAEADMSNGRFLKVVFQEEIKLSGNLLAEIAGQFKNRLLFNSAAALSLTIQSSLQETAKHELKEKRQKRNEEEFENLLTILELYVKKNSLVN